MMTMEQFGGVPLATSSPDSYSNPGENDAWDFGYIFNRTPEQQAVDDEARRGMVDLTITGSWNDDDEMIGLWNCSKQANNGQHFTAFWQQTGSCVGNGGGQAVWYLSAVEVVRLGDPEQVILPFYLLPYGRSRFYGGLRGRGSGSFGSSFAKAIGTDGILPYQTQGLPQPTISEADGITWGSNTELAWSDGAAIEEKWLTASRKHLIQSTANCPNADAAWEAVSNYYPLTIASDWGGQMKPQVQDGALLNRRVTTWMHQMCVIGRWRHKSLGKLFYILNSWGPRTHGTCPSGAPPGGFWVTFAEMEYICRQRECFAFSQFQGFPAQRFTWSRM